MFILSFFALLIALFAFFWFERHSRAAAVKTMAQGIGFTYIGGALPRSLTLDGTVVAGASSVWNVIDGEQGGVRVIAFDCRIPRGRGSWQRTVIAAQGPRNVFASGFDSGWAFDRSGDWAIMYRPQKHSFFSIGLMSVAELEAQLRAIG